VSLRPDLGQHRLHHLRLHGEHDDLAPATSVALSGARPTP
jgi:hypothetical protein